MLNFRSLEVFVEAEDEATVQVPSAGQTKDVG
jgi:hypothetical protein